MSILIRQVKEPTVLDRTVPVRRRTRRGLVQGPVPVSLPFEVALFASQAHYEGDVAEVLARFRHKGDAFTYAHSMRLNPAECYLLVIRNHPRGR